MNGTSAKYFEDEIYTQIKHKEKGVVAMANQGKDLNGSRVFRIEDVKGGSKERRERDRGSRR